MHIIIMSIILIAIACWLGSWLIVGVGMACVKLADKFHKLTKGKWQ